MRRKFLRQNRDIARVNSAQSLRIRSLESECGRLLSENLTLSGRILELEKALEESSGAHRIADHALEIKAKMEAQLIEWGAMVQTLGVEPAAKRHASTSPGGTKIARSRKDSTRSPAAKRRPRDSRSAEDAARLEEGRLPAIHENKTYPRRTMRYADMPGGQIEFSTSANAHGSHTELLAICADAEDTNDSPDLGPPPTSRFVEEDPVKVDSPSRSTGVLEPSAKIKSEPLPPPDAVPQLKLDPKKKPNLPSEMVVTTSPEPTKSVDVPARPLLKAGSKRKFGEENDDIQAAKSLANKEKANGQSAPGKPLAVRDLKDRGSAKILQATKHGERNARVVSKVGRPRKPLAEKTTNDDLVSPKKLVQLATDDDLKKIKADSDRAVAPLKKKRVVPIKLAIPHLPAPTTVKPSPQEPATPSADPGIVFPDTPETKSTEANPNDTPPPADISVHGETSRPSRRARGSISYAEPNLRDKMRRPTKELLDAVSGEGKFARSSSTHILGPLSSSKLKGEDEVSVAESSKIPKDAEKAMEAEAARRPAVSSPLLQKEPSKEQSRDDLPDSVVTERRRRPSSRQSQLFEQQESEDADGEDRQDETDPYEFKSTSPTLEQPQEPAVKGRITKGMRRLMAAGAGQSGYAAEGSRPSRKRASMAAPKKTSMLLESPTDDDSSFDSSGEPMRTDPSSTLKDMVSRRRSMML